VDVYKLDVILLQDIMSEGGQIVYDLEKKNGGWKFVFVDSRSRSRGLISRWKSRFLSCVNCWVFLFRFGYNFILIEFGKGDNCPKYIWSLC